MGSISTGRGGASTNIVTLIADPYFLHAQSLAQALDRFEDIAVIGHHPVNGPDTCEAAVRYRVDVVLMDFWMPEIDGPISSQLILSTLPNCKVLLLTGFYSRQDVKRAFDMGAVGFLPKGCSVDDVAGAIRQAHALDGGNAIVLDKEVEALVDKLEARSEQTRRVWTALSSLTPREVQILSMLNQGLQRDEIAKRLFVSPQTIHTHIRNLLKKAGGRPQSELLYHARRFGLFQS